MKLLILNGPNLNMLGISAADDRPGSAQKIRTGDEKTRHKTSLLSMRPIIAYFPLVCKFLS